MLTILVVHTSKTQAQFLAESLSLNFYDCSMQRIENQLRCFHALKSAEDRPTVVVYALPGIGQRILKEFEQDSAVEVKVQPMKRYYDMAPSEHTSSLKTHLL